MTSIRFFVIVVLLFSLFFGYTFVQQQEKTTKQSPEVAIASFVKEKIKGVTSDEMRMLMVKHYQQLHLLSDEMKWSEESLAAIDDDLLPPRIEESYVAGFIDAIAYNAGKNPYLMDFLDRAAKEDISAFIETAHTYGSKDLPSVIAYGMVLDRLTRAMVKDPEVFAACVRTFQNTARDVGMAAFAHPLELEKLHLVENYVLGFVYLNKTGLLFPQFGKNELPENIMWAVEIDEHAGYGSNADVGKLLIHYGPGYDGGPTAEATPDGRSILLRVPEPLHWAHLYSTWNMAFVSQYSDFPFVIMKLLIPIVSDYEDDPERYLYARSIALYTHIYHFLLGQADSDHLRSGSNTDVVWNNEELTKLWGKVNEESAQDYSRRVESSVRIGSAAKQNE